MAIHYFHCSDGVDLILDREGREVSGTRELGRYARDAAEGVMRAVPSYDDWESWAVYVYGERGQVAVVPFLPGLEGEIVSSVPGDAEGRPGSALPMPCEAKVALAAPAA